MKRLSMALVGSTLALLAAGPAARANPVSVTGPPTITITENWEPNVFKVYAAGANPSVTPNDHYISFSDETAHQIDVPTPSAPAWLGPNQILATNLNAVTSASFANPDKVNTNYTLAMKLTGSQSPTDTATLLFTGHLSATFYNYQGTDGKQHTYFNGQNTYTSPVTQVATLEGNTISVTLDPFAHPTTGSTNNGSIGAEVTAKTVGGGGSGPSSSGGGGGPSSPEPSGLVLSLLGLSGLGAAAWRRRRAGAAA
jgi:hypothetical protein